ncbi:MAG: hypothetical protein ACPLPR_02055 [Bacillota bacterium]
MCNLSTIKQTNIESFATGLAALTDMAIAASKLAQKLASAEQTLKQIDDELTGLSEALKAWKDAPPGEKLATIDRLAGNVEDCVSRVSSIVGVAQMNLKSTN